MLSEHFGARQELITGLIRELVERETTSREAARLDEIAHFVASLLRPFSSGIDLFDNPGYGTHLRARFHFGQENSNGNAGAQVLVIGHLDTVWPVGTLERLPFHITDEGRAHGPGIFDMKSGVAVVIEALRTIAEQKLTTAHPVTLLLTCDEEIGSRTSRDLVEEEARRAVAALVLEPPITGGIVKTARKGVGGFTIRAVGRAAHAGLDPRKGINAVIELAHQTLRLNELNDYERGTTVNVGVVSGGTTSNVIPAEATAKVDMRFWTLEDARRIEETVKNLKPVVEGAQLEISGGINRPPMRRSEGNAALYEHARRLAAEIGFELMEGSVGGGSDGNFTAAMGVPTLDGLGVDGAGAHAEHEHIILSDIPRRAALLTRLIQTV
ncbi:MAG TPA: M20 family metallopeptidase [Blastocatellia bacterium]|nr:M20 family metallopeptidase [Blastocatellia bacterium]